MSSFRWHRKPFLLYILFASVVSQNTYCPLYIQSGLPDAQVQTPAIIYHLNPSGTNKVSCNRPYVDIPAELFGVMSCLPNVIHGYFIFVYSE